MERPNKKPTLIQTIVEELLAAASADQLQKASANPQATRREFEEVVRSHMRNKMPMRLAQIAMHGKAHSDQDGTSIYEMLPDGLPTTLSGRAILRRMAVATILAEMYDRIRGQSSSQRVIE